MSDDDQERATVNQPIHGPRRRVVTPLLAVLGLIVLILVVFAIVTWLRYST
jgi:hypothetical protein